MLKEYTFDDIIKMVRAWIDTGDVQPLPKLTNITDSFIELKRAENGLDRIIFRFNLNTTTVSIYIRERTVLFKVVADVSPHEQIVHEEEISRKVKMVINTSNGHKTLSSSCIDVLKPDTSYIQLVLSIWVEILEGLINWYDDKCQSDEFYHQMYDIFRAGTPDIIHSMVIRHIITDAMANEWLTLRKDVLNGNVFSNINKRRNDNENS